MSCGSTRSSRTERTRTSGASETCSCGITAASCIDETGGIPRSDASCTELRSTVPEYCEHRVEGGHHSVADGIPLREGNARLTTCLSGLRVGARLPEADSLLPAPSTPARTARRLARSSSRRWRPSRPRAHSALIELVPDEREKDGHPIGFHARCTCTSCNGGTGSPTRHRMTRCTTSRTWLAVGDHVGPQPLARKKTQPPRCAYAQCDAAVSTVTNFKTFSAATPL